MYKHHDKTGEHISLHDCKAEKVKFKNGYLTFYFKDGFWIFPSSEFNGTDKTLRTDAAKVRFHLQFEDIYDFSFYVFSRSKKRRFICTEPKIKKFIKKINKGKYSVEFLYMYSTKSNDLKIAECVLWGKKPRSERLYIKIDADSTEYCWNGLTEREW